MTRKERAYMARKEKARMAREEKDRMDGRINVDFPFEIMCEIFLRLLIEDLVRCKCVCKTWRNIIREPVFINLQMNRALSQPRRIILAPRDPSNHGPKNNLFLAGTKKCTKILVKNLKLSCDSRIAGSCNGLICIASRSLCDPVFICNPVTKECRELPEHGPKYFGTVGVLYGFGFDRISKKYKVVCVYRPCYWDSDYFEGNVTEDPVTTGEIITEGEDSWRKLEFPYQVEFGYGSETVFLDEAFHWMIDRDDPTSGSELILALDISNEQFHTINVPPVELPDSFFLINFAESLAFVESCTVAGTSRIWQIIGSEINGRSTNEYICEYVSEENGIKYYCKVIGKLSDGSFLYKATKRLRKALSWQTELRDHLALYIPEKKQSLILKMKGTPKCFRPICFTPTLVSPKDMYFPTKPQEREERVRGRGSERDEIGSRSVSPSFSMELILRKGQAVRKRLGEERKKRGDRKKTGKKLKKNKLTKRRNGERWTE